MGVFFNVGNMTTVCMVHTYEIFVFLDAPQSPVCRG